VGRIRTCEALSSLSVFKTDAIDRSATTPQNLGDCGTDPRPVSNMYHSYPASNFAASCSILLDTLLAILLRYHLIDWLRRKGIRISPAVDSTGDPLTVQRGM
jgi:hypothetical protein